ncbi:MAG: hypothetical protein AAFO83_00955 [Cyanobacteria bacterium J06607_13]
MALDSGQGQAAGPSVSPEEALMLEGNAQKAAARGVTRAVNAALPAGTVAASGGGIRIQDSVPAVPTPQSGQQASPPDAQSAGSSGRGDVEQQQPGGESSSPDDSDPEAVADPQDQSNGADQVVSTMLQPLLDRMESMQAQFDDVNNRLTSTQAERDEAQRQLASVQQQLEDAQRASQFVESLQRLTGSNSALVAPVDEQGNQQNRSGTMRDRGINFNIQTAVDDSPKGRAAELITLMNGVEQNSVRDSKSRMTMTQRDGAPISAFVQNCLADARSQGRHWHQSELVKDVESWLKGAGLLTGSETQAVAGPTTGAATSVPAGYLDVLSAIMRETHNTSNIFWQFTRQVYDSTSAPGKNILVPRIEYLDPPDSIADFLLSDFDTYNPVGLAVGTNTDSQAQVISDVPIGIAQYGLGRSTSVANRPVFIPEFHQATGLIDLLQALDLQLMQNYYKFEELLIRLRYEASTIVRYNNAGNVEDTATNINAVAAGADMTTKFLDSVYTEMFGSAVPTLPDNCYMAALNPTALNQLKQSLDDDWDAPSNDQLMQLSSILRAATGVEIGRASGYQGMYQGFHIFASNSFGVGAAAGSSTVTDVALGAALNAVDMADSFAFGPGAVGRGVAMPMEIRPSGVVPYGLGEAYIWVSREGVGDLDVDSAIDADQQDRVWKLRTTRTALTTA